MSVGRGLRVNFDRDGLVPVVVQDHLTGDVRMFAHATIEAVRATLDTGRATFWSRSRNELWEKGRTSGNSLDVKRVLVDCDDDCLIYLAEPQGATCHTGAPSCFFQILEGDRLTQATEQPQTVFAALESILESRKKSTGGESYTKGLYDSGATGIGAKISEDAGELAKALESGNEERIVVEAAETLYHVLVGLRSRSITLRRVLSELARRVGRSAHPDPESRGTLQAE
jgi:phosphoribosyl-ATP pyrophosphohydrolase/phosphoribosyl-AMP cyclohydrolase